MKYKVPDHAYKLLVEASPYPVYLCMGEQLIVTIANTATLKAWGKTNNVIGLPFYEALPELEGQPFTQLLLNVYRSGVAFHSGDEKAVLEVDGRLQTYYFNFSYQPFRDECGVITGVFCFATDVTELVLAREKIQASEESMRLAVAAAELGTFDKNLATGVMYWDRRCRELFNIKHENDVTYEDDFLPGLHPDDRDRVNRYINEFAFVRPLSEGNYDVEYRTAGTTVNNLRWIRSKGKVFFDENDTPVRFIGSVLDITDQKLSEERKNNFITIASHELKTPLTSVKSYIQVLLAKARTETDGFRTESLTRVEKQVNKMIFLVQNFLNNSKILEERLDLQIESFNMHELLTEITADAQLISNSHKVILKDCESVIVTADKIKIGQVVENLLSNAIKYSPKGSTVTIDCEVKDGFAQISVIDNGIGISLKDQEKLFERFYRVNTDRLKNISGFGIGLYLVAEILRYHNSRIYVKSEEGAGSVFYFKLPLATKA